MILGLDMGGTQTDTVLVERGRVIRATKTPTGDDLLETLRTAIDHTLGDLDPGAITRLAFSTTMATNAIVQDQLEPAGMIVSAGPGMDPAWFSVGPSYHIVDGCLDHQGYEVKPLDRAALVNAVSRIREKQIRVLGLVGKFSVRNPLHELQMAEWVGDVFLHKALGHQVSGVLNFPRRITTTYLNAALYPLQQRFSEALVGILNEKALKAPRYLLKPDGGTVELGKSDALPARTAQSGPAASVMGALALDACKGTTLILDIGGTTTDMAVILEGVPLFNPHGIRLGPYQTLIRSLLTHSLGIGGDSEVRMGKNDQLKIGPLRKGRPMALGGPAPTPTDAMIALNLLDVGEKEAAVGAMATLGAPLGMNGKAVAQTVLTTMAESIAEAVEAFLYEINSQPVYTVHEVLKDTKIDPTSVLIMGGPAPQITPYVGDALELPCRVPPHHDVANAVGAAVARVTTSVTLQADTQRGTVIIPEADLEQDVSHRFGLDQALILGRQVLEEQARRMGAEHETLEVAVTEKQLFNMIRQGRITGQNIRLKMSIIPGLIPHWIRR
ncbi:MAG: hydantoinase/oxoprolinase family protein [Deltaproteobacteria bacterium]|nr:hydantoinase/oxoprolinase family protein [Deltaproteobacteria bacterium]